MSNTLRPEDRRRFQTAVMYAAKELRRTRPDITADLDDLYDAVLAEPAPQVVWLGVDSEEQERLLEARYELENGGL